MSSLSLEPAATPAAPDVRIGCAGWSLASQVAHHFPTQGMHLERYAQVFSCVEINSSFYRAHQPRTYARWAASVPAAFRFSVKLPRTITHAARLQGDDAALDAFFSQAGCLGDKLGYLLVQLPPSLALDAEVASRFFQALRARTAVPVALEPRHVSWFGEEGAAVMQQADVSCVLAHPAPVRGLDLATIPLVYCRLHGAPRIYYSGYEAAFINALAARIQAARHAGKAVWCIFDNTAAGEAVPNALSLQQVLGAAHAPR